MSSLRMPSVSWNAATWSAPIVTAVCETLYSLIGYFLPHEAASKLPALIAVCMIGALVALLLLMLGRSPRARGAAIGCLVVPLALALLQENVKF